jgi:hypothetical protein
MGIHKEDKNGFPFNEYTHEEYHSESEYVGSSTLKKIAGNRSTDYLFVETEDKIHFKEGNAFELMVYDKINYTYEFEDKYYITNLKSRPSDILDLIKDEDLENHLEFTKKGELAKKERNYWLEELALNNRKFPLKKDEYEVLKKMTENFLKLEFRGLRLADCIERAEIETPIFWEVELPSGVILKKKCKPDFHFIVDGIVFSPDIKTTGKALEEFNYDFNKLGYWIQAAHYMEGLGFLYPDLQIRPMPFAVSCKKEPYLSQIFSINEKDLMQIKSDYQDLCEKYASWKENRKPKFGCVNEEGTLNYKFKKEK